MPIPTRHESASDVRPAAVPLAELVGFLDALLAPARFRDVAPNGLQVPGPDAVATVVTGVSAHAELLERAAAEDADLVLVHHGLFWRGDPQTVGPVLHRRLKVLYAHDMALAAYHLPLDGHPEVGNNALVAERLGAHATTPFAPVDGGAEIGALATLPGEGVTPAELVDRLAEATGHEVLAFLAGPQRVRRVGVVSGGGTDFVGEAAAAGADAFVTGEPAERAMGLARDLGIHFLAAGHHATETFGVRRLGELLEERFGVRHAWVDVPNPI